MLLWYVKKSKVGLQKVGQKNKKLRSFESNNPDFFSTKINVTIYIYSSTYQTSSKFVDARVMMSLLKVSVLYTETMILKK